MQKLFQTSIQQTGVALLEIEGEKERVIPLFSRGPVEEANRFVKNLHNKLNKNIIIKNVFYSNNLMDYKIEDLVRDFIKENGFLPSNYINDMVSGFPFICSNSCTSFFYA